MATTLGSTGVTFPDSTTQTTAITANPAITNVRQAVTSASTTTINLASGSNIDLTMAANISTLSFTNVAASGTAMMIQIIVRNASSGTAYTITWPSSIYWNSSSAGSAQTAPTLATGANGVTVIALLTTDGGTKWRGWVESSIPGGSTGELYGWGQNGSSRLGLQNTTAYSSPKQIGTLNNWSTVAHSGQGTTVAIKTDGTMWSWGSNVSGVLGHNNAIYYSSPKQIGSLTSWSKIAISRAQSVKAIKTDGTIWSWGAGTVGMLGLNSTTPISSPTQIGSGTSWSSVSGGSYHFMALKTDGTLWAWGVNSYGQLGMNNTNNSSSPVQIGADTNWASVMENGYDSSSAIRTTGTLWTWGKGSTGILGHSDQSGGSSPKQVGTLTNWSRISMSTASSIAIKTDGTLWNWGNGGSGQLGKGDSISVSSPIQLGTNTDWTNIHAGYNFQMGTRGSLGVGALWAWGDGSNGRLGLGNVSAYNSPKQVGALTNWKIEKGSTSGGSMFGIIRNDINPA